MKSEVLAIVEELKRLRRAGASHALVSDEAMEALRALQRSGGKPASAPPKPEPTREEVLQSIPEGVRSASAGEFDALLKKPAASSPAPASKPAAKPAENALSKPPVVSLPQGDKRARWEALREQVLGCPVCAGRTPNGCKVVFGVGNIDADIFFCGEAPGAEEERQGEPFVGPAGQLLTKMIEAAGLTREQVYIGNIMNWRPDVPTGMGNRPPTEEEIGYCLPYLRAQLEVVRPKVVIALGVTACKGLLGFDAFRSLREIKGQWHEFAGIPVMPTYHPSYLLHNSSKRDKRAAWEDWLKAMEKVGLPISDRQRGFFL